MTTHTFSQFRRAAATAMSIALLTSLAACGDDDAVAQTAAGSVPVTIASSAAPAEPAPDISKACAAQAGFSSSVQQDLPFPEGDEATEKELAGIRAFATDRMVPLGRDLATNAPASLSAAVSDLRADIDALADTGDLSTWQSTATGVYPHYNAVALGLLPSCGPVVTVHATEYRYAGIPATIEAGTVRFHLINDGREAHEIAVIRRAPGNTASLAELAKLSVAEVEKLAGPDEEYFVGIGYAYPAGTSADESVITLDLTEPGRYLIFDLAKTGTTSDDSEGSGPPHYAKGMLAELTVSKAPGGDRNIDKACAANYEISNTFQTETPFPAGDEPTERELAAVRAFAADRLAPLVEELVANVPAALAARAEQMREHVSKLATDGDLTPFFSTDSGAYPDFTAVALGLLSSCGDRVIEVRVSESEIDGVPAELAADLVRFHVVSTGKEAHELILVRRAADDTGDLASIRALSPDQLQARYDTADSRAAFVYPAGTSADEAVLAVRLQPGRYLLFDPSNAGTTSDDDEGDGPPNYTRGLLIELIVTGVESDGK